MGAEGIMIKNPQSAYQAGNRGWAWIKFKADYRPGVADTFDLVVVGAYWGQGRRSGWYGALLLAAVNEKTGEYEAVSRLATGFDDATLATLEKKFEPHVAKSKPKNVTSEEIPDVWMQPSIVLEVLGAELTLSPRYTVARGVFKGDAGLSVRFPRFTGRWRDDKKPSQATTDEELVKFYKARMKAQARSTT
jgi:DNA ligase-1